MSSPLPLRVLVHKTWDEVLLKVPADSTVGALKEQALAASNAGGDPDGFEVKFRGALIRDESQDLASAGLVPNAQLIVLARRRQPVR